ncbi:MAG: hypothetical protein J2P41_11945 [Blastocatellia bacterium]|nr:hypothetical protein [Blastocatellia bacterium]
MMRSLREKTKETKKDGYYSALFLNFKEEAKKAKSNKRGKKILGLPSSPLFVFFAHFCPFCFLFKRGASSYK